MLNKPIRVFDNIGFNFTVDNSNIKQLASIKTYNTLNSSHVGYLVPYVARNLNNRLFETGVGEVVFDSNGNIVVKRLSIISSSNNNSSVNFPDSGNDFYVFANQSSFDNALNNTIIIDKDSELSPISALYLVDCSLNNITIQLPVLDTIYNLILEFKLIETSHNLIIRDKDSILCSLDSSNNYARVASNGQDWVILNNRPAEKIQIQSSNNTDSNEFSILSNTLSDGELFWDADSQRIFIGANSSSAADTIIPTSGSYPFIVNNQGNGSDFVVYGSGSLDKNLFFAYDGRVGVNIPSGSRPSTVFHIVNTICQEGLRLENRTSCYPANITLYHKPTASITNGSVVSQINLAAKNSTGNQTNYSKIESRAVETTTYAEKGALDITVVSGVTGIKTISTAVDSTVIGYGTNKLQINNNGNLLLTNGTTQISVNPQSSITFSASSIYATGTSYLTTLSSQNVETSNLVINNLTSSGLLMISGGRIVNSPLSINSIGSLNLPVAPNKLLSTTSTGSITGIYTLDDYFLTEQDIVWTKYSPRSASACLRQITFSDDVPQEEFSAGDQIVISSNGSNIYRRVISLELNGEIIVGLLVDQNVTQSDTSNLNVSSITKGGYLTIKKNVDDGVISDGTENIISIQPLTDTVFNTKQKDINFIVYGLDENPALSIKANSGRVLQPSGIYAPFATAKQDMFPIVVTTGGVGISKDYSSANYNYDISRNLFSGILSNVGTNGLPSYYGTYDQNGNVAEWVEKISPESRDVNEFVAGGSYLTEHDSVIGPSGLKSIESLPRMSAYDYVGFRVAGLQGIVDSTAISQPTGLNVSFVPVTDPKNIKDSSTTYVKNSSGSYSSIVLNNLGSVNNLYRISKYEVTNKQYCKFLNAVASSKTINRGLYDTRMHSSDLGGILRIDTGIYEYISKPNMEDKPVVFVSYLNAIRFINWMHNGASPSVSDSNIDYILNNGSYNIYLIGTDTYNIAKSSYRKYWLPDLNEWHKAAYYRPVNGNNASGTSAVMIKRDDPYLVASGVDATTKQQTQVFANLSVSGWLYADHIMIGDGTIMSSLSALNLQEGTTDTTTNTQTTITPNNVPKISLDDQWNNRNSKSILGSMVSCTGCAFDGKPLRLDDDTYSLCTDTELVDNDNVPWWCDDKNNGPGWFI